MSSEAKKAIKTYITFNVNSEITKEKADEICKHFYYHNHSKYVSEVLGRMVSSGELIRKARGLYIKGPNFFEKQKTEPIDENQLNLFQ